MTREEVEALDPPTDCSWVGEWDATHVWDLSMDDDAEGDPVWLREALVHDGHEECCGHTRYVIHDRTVVAS